MNEPFEATLDKFLQNLATLAIEKINSKNSTVTFWEESFTHYIGKMRIPKKIDKNPRRYFHLHAMKYVIDQTKPAVIWNICVGNIKTSMPVLEHIVELSEQASNVMYLINIDIVPAIVKYNNSFLRNHLKFAQFSQLENNNFIKYKNTKIFNCIGSVEDFLDIFAQYFDYHPLKHVFLCLDGLSNVVLEPDKWFHWWTGIQDTLEKYFIAWYLTWLQPSTLLRKFSFYYDVVLQKHNIPINWIEIEKLGFVVESGSIMLQGVELLLFEELSDKSLQKVMTEQDLPRSDLLFKFYSDKSKTLLIYQALYLTENMLVNLYKHIGNTIVGHKNIDSLIFDASKVHYDAKEDNFVKSIPVIGFKKEQNRK